MPTKSKKKDASEAEKKAAEAAIKQSHTPESSRLSSKLGDVEEIEKRLRTEKVPLGDRHILAKNLGEILEQALRSGGVQSDRQVFLDAFGEAIGESKYKKRKDYVLKRGEGNALDGSQSSRLAARGNDYLALLTALVRANVIPTIKGGDPMKFAILSMVEGSSYDSNIAKQSRQLSELVSDIKRVEGIITDRVLKEVDLDDLKRFVAKANIRTERPNFDEVKGIGEDPERKPDTYSMKSYGAYEADMETAGDIFGYTRSAINPRAVIGQLYTQLKVDGVKIEPTVTLQSAVSELSLYELAKSEHPLVRPYQEHLEEIIEQLADEYADYDQEEDISDLMPLFSEQGFSEEQIKEASFVSEAVYIADEMLNYIEPDEVELEDFEGSGAEIIRFPESRVYLRREVALEMRYDTEAKRWIVCLNISPSVPSHKFIESCEGYWQWNTLFEDRDWIVHAEYGVSDSYKREVMDTWLWGGPPLLITSEKRTLTRSNALTEEDESVTTLGAFVCKINSGKELADAVEDSGFYSGSFPIGRATAIEKLSSSLLGPYSHFEAAIDSERRYTSAPAYTLADVILSNLAYASIEESIPNLMARDARAKATRLFELQEQSTREYKEGLNRW